MTDDPNQKQQIPRAARKALLNWFASKEGSRAAAMEQLYSDLFLGDLDDLTEHIADRYGPDAAVRLEQAQADNQGSISPRFAAYVEGDAADETMAEALALALPDPLFAALLESATLVMQRGYELRYDSPGPDATDYIQSVFAEHRVPYEVTDEGIAPVRAKATGRPAATPSSDEPASPASVAGEPESSRKLDDFVVNADQLCVELFGVEWRALRLQDLEAFFEAVEANDEPLHWEAKGTSLPTKDKLRKGAGGFGNREGGFFIVGGTRDANGQWHVDPVEFTINGGEPGTWLGDVVQSIENPPMHDVRVLQYEGGQLVALIKVEPNEGYISTVDGRVPERHHGKTTWVATGSGYMHVAMRVRNRTRSTLPSLAPVVRVPVAAKTQAPPPQSAAAELSSTMTPAAFADAVNLALDNGDTARIRVFLSGATDRAKQAMDPADADALIRELDRITDCAAASLAKGNEDMANRCVWKLQDVFDRAWKLDGRSTNIPRHEALAAALTRARALGGLAVRLEEWSVARKLVQHEVSDGGRVWPSWFRPGEVAVTSSGFWAVKGNLMETGRAPLRRAAALAIELPSLHPDGVVDESALISSQCQFDFLVNAIASWAAHEDPDWPSGTISRASMPYYVAWDGERAAPMAYTLVSSSDARAALLPVDDEHLSSLLWYLSDRADKASQGLGSWAFWSGLEDHKVWTFMQKHPPTAP